jgi:hypothetical protein
LALGCKKDPAPARDNVADAAVASKSALTTRPAASVVELGAPPSTRVQVPESARDACRSVCERSKQLKCAHTDECLTNCMGMATLTPCSAEFSKLFPCWLHEPVEHWECGEDGVGAIRDGYCDKEQAEAVACMEKKMQP